MVTTISKGAKAFTSNDWDWCVESS
jgi:hypothetical protein